MEILPPPPEYLLQNEWTQRMGNEFIVVVSYFLSLTLSFFLLLSLSHSFPFSLTFFISGVFVSTEVCPVINDRSFAP